LWAAGEIRLVTIVGRLVSIEIEAELGRDNDI
jgi:hypothetical protein